jgi:hypothetical protein
MDEQELHQRFAHLRIRGEWFRPASDLMAFINSLKGPQKPHPDPKVRDGQIEQIKLLAAAYPDSQAVTCRVSKMLSQFRNLKKSADDEHRSHLRQAILDNATELEQIVRDGGKYIHDNHWRDRRQAFAERYGIIPPR